MDVAFAVFENRMTIISGVSKNENQIPLTNTLLRRSISAATGVNRHEQWSKAMLRRLAATSSQVTVAIIGAGSLALRRSYVPFDPPNDFGGGLMTCPPVGPTRITARP